MKRMNINRNESPVNDDRIEQQKRDEHRKVRDCQYELGIEIEILLLLILVVAMAFCPLKEAACWLFLFYFGWIVEYVLTVVEYIFCSFIQKIVQSGSELIYNNAIMGWKSLSPHCLSVAHVLERCWHGRKVFCDCQSIENFPLFLINLSNYYIQKLYKGSDYSIMNINEHTNKLTWLEFSFPGHLIIGSWNLHSYNYLWKIIRQEGSRSPLNHCLNVLSAYELRVVSVGWALSMCGLRLNILSCIMHYSCSSSIIN